MHRSGIFGGFYASADVDLMRADGKSGEPHCSYIFQVSEEMANFIFYRFLDMDVPNHEFSFQMVCVFYVFLGFQTIVIFSTRSLLFYHTMCLHAKVCGAIFLFTLCFTLFQCSGAENSIGDRMRENIDSVRERGPPTYAYE